jgi:hypothetical protein
LQVNPHAVPLHVAVALATAGHAVHDVVPHELMLAFG